MRKTSGFAYLLKNLKFKENKFTVEVFNNSIKINNITIDLNEIIKDNTLNLDIFFEKLNEKLLEEKNLVIKDAKITFMVNSYKELEKKLTKIILPYFENLECEFAISFVEVYNKKIKIELSSNNKIFSKFNIILGDVSPFYFEPDFLKKYSFEILHIKIKKSSYLNHNKYKTKLNLNNVKIYDTLYMEGINFIEGNLNILELNNIILKNINKIENNFFSNIRKIKNSLILNIIDNTDIDKNLSKIEIGKKIYIESCSKKLENFSLKNVEKVVLENLKLNNVKFTNIKDMEATYITVNSSKFENIENCFLDDGINIRNSIFDNIKNIEILNGKLENVIFNNIEILKTVNTHILSNVFNSLEEISFSNTIDKNSTFIDVKNLNIFLTGYIEDIYKNIEKEKKQEILVIEMLTTLLDIIYQSENKNNNIQKLNLSLSVKELNKKYIKEKFKKSKFLISIILKLIDMVSNKKINVNNNLNNEEIKFLLYHKIHLPMFIINENPQIKNKIISLLGNI